MKHGPVTISRVVNRDHGGDRWDFPHFGVHVAGRWFFLPAGLRATPAIRRIEAAKRTTR